MSADKITRKRRRATWSAQSFRVARAPSLLVLLFALWLIGPIPRWQHARTGNENDIDADAIVRSVFRSAPGALVPGAAHAFVPQSHTFVPTTADAGSTSRRHPHQKRLHMAKLGKMPEYSFDDVEASGASSGGGGAQREIRQLRSDISRTDARLKKLRKESAKMDAASRTATSASASSSAAGSASSAIGTAFRTLITPAVALGAGRSYLQQRNQVQEEIARTEAELLAKREALERVENFTGVSYAMFTC